ncbi:MAG TPA: archease [Methanofastidiosum sp.]|jgi:SHS2 domain-containing protein|nr:archease [Methanofastidiosum sp.]HPC81444.1 archease [Methanofastidiosum sp.]HRS26505.1 archease [Methanofastidiosum sp.]
MDTNMFEYFDVTADIGVKVWGNSINELFENAAIAVTSLMIDPARLKRNITKEIFVEGNDIPSLLINWITELLIIRDSEAILFSSFKVNVSSDGRTLTAKILGDHIIGSTIEMDIKAITYSLFELKELDNSFHVQFVLDI